MKGLGLDRFPHLKEDYFRNYKRLVYFVQKSSPELDEKVKTIGDYLNLPVEIRETGYNLLRAPSRLDGKGSTQTKTSPNCTK